ncbi:aldo-keto reductase family 1 member B1-like [Schistocerca americana]|uniref:aldo-keto reductase family 1 member B1-like n=1 Tax=Schistocerca americana TaxID=7009 RepID=UPI001F4F8EA9|nr:aldo-keto reductase family 1 member B1-like [Schistocerca americana]XP_047097476.1 aldo-keto reductase family 1 member B1-like [Schistocerca piceifrons]XP_049942005.1 aldo-keto reductase family 1 member B1-like [Schistocerca serialis cubense]
MAPTVKLNNGKVMPVIGIGTWQSAPGEVGEALKYAIEIGYRHIDGAAVYQNEPEVGAALKAKLDDGTVKREELFVTSKLWNTKHRPELVVPACKKTLADLKLDYLDLYLVHWPFAFKEGDDYFPKGEDGSIITTDVDYLDTWKQMEECVRLGLTKSIGVSNFNSKQLARLLEVAKIKPVTNQIECHAYLNQKKLIQFCKERDIVITAYSPLANPSMKMPEGEVPLMQNPKMKELADKYGKSIAQVLLRYLIQIGTVPIPKSVHKERIKENFNVFDFELNAEDLAYIDTFNKNYRVCAFNETKAAIHYPFYEEF